MREPSEMELRVAKALTAKMSEWHGAEPADAEALDYARAAIRAMYELPPDVLEEGEMTYIEAEAQLTVTGPGVTIGRGEDDSCLREAWKAMIDAASPKE